MFSRTVGSNSALVIVRPLTTTMGTGVGGGSDFAGLVLAEGEVTGLAEDVAGCVGAGRLAGGLCRVLCARATETNKQIATQVISIFIGVCRKTKGITDQ